MPRSGRSAQIGDPLPNHASAIMEHHKLTRYIFSTTHPDGRHHAKLLDGALAFNVGTTFLFKRAVLEALPTSQISAIKGKSQYPTLEVLLPLTGPNGKTKLVVTAWIMEGERPRLVSAYLASPQPAEYSDEERDLCKSTTSSNSPNR